MRRGNGKSQEERRMIVGIPRERFVDERRVGLSPAGVRSLVELGATAYIESNAGTAAGWSDAEYEQAGGTIAHSPEEVFGRADLLIKVLSPNLAESEMIREDQIILSYLQLPLARREVFQNLVDRGVTAIGLENIENENGHPVRRVMSEIAGPLAVLIAADYLSADRGGRGVLISGVPGVPPASVGIIGAGVVGTAAAETALNLGASVVLVDHRVAPLRYALDHFGKRLQTSILNKTNVEKLCQFVDVLITAVLVEDYPTPHVVSREQVKMMKPRSVIVDVAIDQGGTVETSRPTTLSNPTYVEEKVIHYCVPNIPAKVPRTATRAFMNQVLPFARKIVRDGIKKSLLEHPYLNTGLNLYEGQVARETVGKAFGVDWVEGMGVVR
ncbi:MAG: alanine dehydrogenase [bacterium]